jgi:hypothetical protein
MTHAYQTMMTRVLTSDPREEDLLITLCQSLNWGVEIDHVKGLVTVTTHKCGYGFHSVSDALNWFRRSGNIRKVPPAQQVG